MGYERKTMTVRDKVNVILAMSMCTANYLLFQALTSAISSLYVVEAGHG